MFQQQQVGRWAFRVGQKRFPTFKFMEYEKRLEVMALAAAAAPCAPLRSNMPAALMPGHQVGSHGSIPRCFFSTCGLEHGCNLDKKNWIIWTWKEDWWPPELGFKERSSSRVFQPTRKMCCFAPLNQVNLDMDEIFQINNTKNMPKFEVISQEAAIPGLKTWYLEMGLSMTITTVLKIECRHPFGDRYNYAIVKWHIQSSLSIPTKWPMCWASRCKLLEPNSFQSWRIHRTIVEIKVWTCDGICFFLRW